jgi:small-conductance mechanosensitive channel
MESFWKIPEQTMCDWWRNREKILQSKGGARQTCTVWICTWPELEKNLYTEFLQRRAAGNIIRRSWFRRRSKKLWKEIYPSLETSLFVFSNSWFQGFCRRCSITLRYITRQVRYILFWFYLEFALLNLYRHQSFLKNIISLYFHGFDLIAVTLSFLH